MLQSLNYFPGPLLNSVQYIHVSLVLRSPELNADLASAEWRGRSTCLSLLGNTLPNAAQDISSHLCYKGTSLDMYTWWLLGPLRPFLPTTFPAGWPPQHIPGAWVCSLLNSLMFLSAPFSNMLGFLWLAAQPSGLPATHPNFAPSASLLRVHSAPSFKSSTKMLNRPRPSTDLWGRPLVTSFQLDFASLITTLRDQPFRVFNPPHCLLIQPLQKQSGGL